MSKFLLRYELIQPGDFFFFFAFCFIFIIYPIPILSLTFHITFTAHFGMTLSPPMFKKCK